MKRWRRPSAQWCMLPATGMAVLARAGLAKPENPNTLGHEALVLEEASLVIACPVLSLGRPKHLKALSCAGKCL